MKQYAKAGEQIRQALRLDPDNAVYHFNYANILQDLGHLEDAIAEYKKALELDPDMKAAKEEIEKLQKELSNENS